MIGQVNTSQVTVNRDDPQPVRVVQCEISEPDDIQDVEQFSQFGEDYNPPPNTNVYVLQEGKAFKIIISSQDNITPTSLPGERQMYSTDASGSAKMANIYLKVDSTVEIKTIAGTLEINPAGVVTINAGTDAAGLASKIDTLWATFYAMFAGWVPVLNDGGTALKNAFLAAFPTPPTTVASQKLKVDL